MPRPEATPIRSKEAFSIRQAALHSAASNRWGRRQHRQNFMNERYHWTCLRLLQTCRELRGLRFPFEIVRLTEHLEGLQGKQRRLHWTMSHR